MSAYPGSPSGGWGVLQKAAHRLVPSYEMEVDLVAVSRVATCSTKGDWLAGARTNVGVSERGEVSLSPGGSGLVLLDTTVGSPATAVQGFRNDEAVTQEYSLDLFIDPAYVGGQPVTLSQLTLKLYRDRAIIPFLGRFIVTVSTYDEQWRKVPLGDPITLNDADSPFFSGTVTIDFVQDYQREFVLDPATLQTRTGGGLDASGNIRAVNVANGLSQLTVARALSISIRPEGGSTVGAGWAVVPGLPAFTPNAFWRVLSRRTQGPYYPFSPPIDPRTDANLDGFLVSGAVPGYGAIASASGEYGIARRVTSENAKQGSQGWEQPYAKVTARTVQPSGTVVVVLDLGSVPTNELQFRADDWVRRGTAITYALRGRNSTGDAWTTIGAMLDGDVIPAAFRFYEVTATLTATAVTGGFALVSPVLQAVQITERVRYRTEGLTGAIDADATIDPVTGQSSIGELMLPLLRGGRDDFRDLATAIASGVSPSRLEAQVFGVDRASGFRKFLEAYRLESRTPFRDREEFRFVSGLDRLQVRVPPQVETYTFPLAGSTAAITGVSGSGGTRVLTIGGASWSVGQLNGYRLRCVTGNIAGADFSITATPSGTTITIAIPSTGLVPLVGDAVEIHSDIYRRQDVVYTAQDPAVVYEDVLTTRARVPRRVIGALPATNRVTDAAGTALATSGRLKASGGADDGVTALSVLQALAALMGGAVVWRRGLISFVDLFTPRESVAVWDERDYVRLETPTGLDRRMPSVSCKFGADPASDQYAGEVVSNDLSVISAAGRANLFDVTAVDDSIAKWCTTQALATAHVTRLRDAFSAGVPVWSVELIHQWPWVDLGDVVTVMTDQYTTRLFRFSPDGVTDESQPIAGRTATVGVVIGRNLAADRFLVLARSTTPVANGSVGGGPTDGPLTPIAVPTTTLATIRGGVQVTYTPPAWPYFARMEFDVRSRVSAGPGAWSAVSRVVGTASGSDFIPFTPEVTSDLEVTPVVVSTGEVRTFGATAVVTVTVMGGGAGGGEPFTSVSLTADPTSNTFIPTFSLDAALAGASITASIRRVYGGIGADVPGVAGIDNYTGVTSGAGITPGGYSLSPFGGSSTTTYTAQLALAAFIGSTQVGSAFANAIFYVDNTGA